MSVYAFTASNISQQSPILKKGLVQLTTSVAIYYVVGENPVASSNNCGLLQAGETREMRFPVKCSRIAIKAVNAEGNVTIVELSGGAKSSCNL